MSSLPPLQDSIVSTPWGLSEDAPCGFVETLVDGAICRANERFAQWAGRPADALLGLRFKSLLTPASRILYDTHCIPLLEAQGLCNEVMLEIVRPDSGRVPVLISAIRDVGGERGNTMFSIFDATVIRQHERALQDARKRAESSAQALTRANGDLALQTEHLRVTLRSMAETVVTTDRQGLITSINPTAQHLFGIAENDALGAPLTALGQVLYAEDRGPVALHPTRLWTPGFLNLIVVHRDGSEREVACTVARIGQEDGPGDGTVFVGRDVTDERALVRRLAHEASHDHLTGLLNRREFERRVHALADDANVPGVTHLLCYLDLDQFKVVNDTVGHDAGDQLLIEVAALLRDAVRDSDVLARLGGDEFGLVLTACAPDAGLEVAQSLLRRVASMRFEWEGHPLAITASLGLAVLGTKNATTTSALADADMACHAAKEKGRNRVQTFAGSDAALRATRGEMGWIPRIRRALDQDRFALCFQPIVRLDARPGELINGEMLLRMRDDDGKLLAPAAFVSAAERYNQIQAIDRWVVRKAFAWLATHPGHRASINLSGQSVGDADLLAFVLRQFDTAGIAPQRVCFEITETATMGDLGAALRFMHALREIGVAFALDDFGVGLSSFSYLKELPVDVVKIDGSFTKSLLTDRVNRTIVESIAQIAKVCGLETVAEWVESEAVMDAIGLIGIDKAQGRHVGMPTLIETL